MTIAVRDHAAGRLRNAAVALVLATLVAACGARLSPDERAIAIRGGGGSRATTDAADDIGTPTNLTADQLAGGASATPPASSAESAGPVTSDTPAAGSPTGPACRPGSATSTGVTPTEVKVGNVSQLTGLVPGFGQTATNGIRSYFAYINSRGGICGRKVSLVQGDDRFQAATNRSETEKLAGQVIAFAGSLSVVDDGGAPVLVEQGVADVSLATTPARTSSPNNFSPNPTDPSPDAANGQDKVLRYLRETRGITKGAIFYVDVATGVNQSKRYARDFANAGIQLVTTYPVAATATNFRTQAADMKQKGVEVVVTIAEINAIANLTKAFADVGYKPKAPFYGAQTYSKKFIQLAGPAAEGAIAGLIFHVPEEVATVPAMAIFSEWYGKAAPGADVDFFAILGWVAGEMVTRAIAQAGPDPTQAKVIEVLRTFTDYRSDYVTPTNPAGKKPADCFLVVEVQNSRWVKIHPNGSGFACD